MTREQSFFVSKVVRCCVVSLLREVVALFRGRSLRLACICDHVHIFGVRYRSRAQHLVVVLAQDREGSCGEREIRLHDSQQTMVSPTGSHLDAKMNFFR